MQSVLRPTHFLYHNSIDSPKVKDELRKKFSDSGNEFYKVTLDENTLKAESTSDRAPTVDALDYDADFFHGWTKEEEACT